MEKVLNYGLVSQARVYSKSQAISLRDKAAVAVKEYEAEEAKVAAEKQAAAQQLAELQRAEARKREEQKLVNDWLNQFDRAYNNSSVVSQMTQAATSSKPKFAPGTLVHYINSGGTRRVGVVAAPSAVPAWAVKLISPTPKVWAYWNGDQRAGWVEASRVEQGA